MVRENIEQAHDATRSRMSDRILYALDLALAQEDVTLCEILVKALEIAMTRKTGGRGFVELRDFPPEITNALDRLAEIRKSKLEAKGTG